MKNIKPVTLSLVFCFIISMSSTAQTKNDFLKTADKFYALGNSYAAAVYYEKYFQVDGAEENSNGFKPYFAKKKDGAEPISAPSLARKDAMYRLAESYRVLNDYSHAEKWYKDVLDQGGNEQYPLTQYWYAVTLRANNKTTDANTAFQTFIDSYKGNDEYVSKAKIELANYPYVQSQLTRTDVGSYKISKSILNEKGATYASSVSNNTVLFSSTRPDTTIKTPKDESPYVNNIYQAKYTDGSYGQPDRLTINNPKGFQQGTAAITASGNRIFFTRWQKLNGKNVSAIYTSEKQNDKWSEAVKLPDVVNAEGSNSKEPFLTSNGHLVFSSDKTGGAGGFDLWEVSIDNDGIISGASRNLGSQINSAYDEQSPFFHSASNTLVYASNGRMGMGGFDLYTSKGSFNGDWQTPVNPGYPVNSVKDDLYFTTTSDNGLFKKAFISSDRNSNCCLELFDLDKEYKKFVKGNVVNDKTNEPLADALVQVMDSAKGRVLYTQISDPAGNYFFDVTANTRPMKFSAEKQGYQTNTVAGTPADAEVDTTSNMVIRLTPIEDTAAPAGPVAPMLLHFDFDKSDIRADAAIVLDSLSAVMKRVPGLTVEIGGYTDGKGKEQYNKNLSTERAIACYNYLVNKGIASRRFSKKGYGECCQVGKEFTEDGKDNPDGRQLNRRAEFKIVGF